MAWAKYGGEKPAKAGGRQAKISYHENTAKMKAISAVMGSWRQ
jgi:hypothetical protein